MASSSSQAEGGPGDGSDGRFHLADELLAHREESYVIDNEVEPSALGEVLDNLIDALSLSPSAIDGEQVFDQVKSFMRGFQSLAGPQRSKLLDAIVSAYTLQIDAAQRDLEAEGIERYKEHKETLERFAFSLQWLTHAAEAAANSREERAAAASAGGASGTAQQGGRGKASAASTTGWDWQRVIPTVLATMAKSLRLSTSILFPLSAARDAFVSGCALKPALLLQENEAHLKTPLIKMSIFKVICNCVKNHGQAFAVQTSIMQALAYYEHLAEPMAELLALLRTEFDYERLGDEVLREVAAREFGGLDTKTPRCFARFVVRMAELSPRSVLRVISLLNKHLDSDSYPMRNAMLEVLGILIKDLTTTDDALPAPQGSNDQEDDFEAGDEREDGQREGGEAARKKQVEQFWALITERFLDVTSYVRCKCISVSSKLCELPAKFPTQRTLLTQLSIQSLTDKSANARKNAVALLTKLILTHPYGVMHGGDLDKTEWTKRLELIDEQLKEFDGVLDVPNEADDEADDDTTPVPEAKQEEVEGDASDGESNLGDDTERPGAEEADEEMKDLKQETRAKQIPRKSLDLEAIASKLSPADAEKVVKLRLTRRYYADALAFIDQMSSAVPMLSQLLVSTSKAEVLESMEFFRVAHEYKLPGANVGVRKMIHLIWTKDNNTLVMEDGKELKGIKSRLIEVYRSLYFDPLPTLGMNDNVNRIARNLVERTFGATLAELTSLEEMLAVMCGEGMIDERVIEKLWSVYSSSKAIPRAQRRGAIIVLSMLAVARKEIVADRIDRLLGIGLGSLGAEDVVLAKYTCIALARVGGSVKKVKGALTDNQVRFPMTHAMFARLRAAIQWPSKSGQWFSLAEHAIQTIYLLGEQPDALCADIIKQMTSKVFGPGGPRGSGETESQASVPSTPRTAYDDDGQEETGSKAPAFALAQLLFVVGHVALKQIVYLEVVEREFKRRKAEADKDKVLANKDTNAAAETSQEQAAAKGAGKKGRRGKKKDAAPEPQEDADELDQVAGNAEDEIGDVVGEVRENELLYGQASLLTHFGPVIVHVCSNPTMYPDVSLRRAAVLSLCKFMCVSSHFCEAHLPLVLSILSTSNDPVVRSNVVIALGDMAISFGNLVDENSEKLYAGLNDTDLGVKKHTLMVLTHLILNGMIKVKGQLGVMAKCLEDEDERLSDLAKLFFSELATKENAIYNQISDIISTATNAYEEHLFQRILRFIFTFIDKDKQAESIVPKLCERFSNTSDDRQWRDIAFCLSLLPYKSDRSVKLLLQGLPWDNQALREPTVFKHLEEIVTKAKTNRTIGAGGAAAAAAAAAAATTTGGSGVQELEAELDKLRAHGLTDADFESATQAKLAKARKRRGAAALTTVGEIAGADATRTSSSTTDSPARSSRGSAAAKSAPERATRATRRTRRAVLADDDDFDG